MPRFFFDVRNHEFYEDVEGLVLPGIAEARIGALQFAGEYLRDNPGQLVPGCNWSVEARDEANAMVLRVKVTVETGAGPDRTGTIARLPRLSSSQEPMMESALEQPATDLAATPVLERMARVLAAWPLAENAEGSEPSVSAEVDSAWPDRLEQAIAVLKAIREPDASIAAAGDGASWSAMVEAALEARSRIDLP